MLLFQCSLFSSHCSRLHWSNQGHVKHKRQTFYLESLIRHDSTGVNGVNGMNALNWMNGVNGVNWMNGVNGVNWMNGVNGVNGTFSITQRLLTGDWNLKTRLHPCTECTRRPFFLLFSSSFLRFLFRLFFWNIFQQKLEFPTFLVLSIEEKYLFILHWNDFRLFLIYNLTY